MMKIIKLKLEAQEFDYIFDEGATIQDLPPGKFAFVFPFTKERFRVEVNIFHLTSWISS